MISDDDVINSVRHGHTQDYEIIINRYSQKLFNFINRMVFDRDESQSLTQDVLVKVYETLPDYKPQNNFRAFIYTIAKNITFNYLKQRKRVLFFSHFFAKKEESNHFSHQDSPVDLYEKQEKEEMLNQALKSLNENQRLALVLKVYLDFSYQQIVEVTGWSVPKIETLISRAKDGLKQKILLQENQGKNVTQVRKK